MMVQIQKQQSHLQTFVTEIGNTPKNKSLHRIQIVFVFVQTEKKKQLLKSMKFSVSVPHLLTTQRLRAKGGGSGLVHMGSAPPKERL